MAVGATLSTGTQLGGHRVSLVIPAWNEADTIRQAIHEADTALAKVTGDYEIIVVDDGSTDATAELVQAEAAQNPRVQLVRHPANRGYGAALRSGFQAARMELVAFTDADCQFDLADLGYMLPLTERYDIACGSRIDRKDSPRRRFLSWGYNTLVTVLMGSPVHDIDCALKVFRRDKLQALMPECDNFFVNTEMLAKARQEELEIVEVGVHHRPRAGGASKVSLRAIPRTLGTLIPFWWSRVVFAGSAPAAGKPDRWFWAGMALLALLAGLLLFPNLSYPLLEPDEGRYAEIAREMGESSDWIVPTLNHQPYYDKPPLLYWLTTASFRMFGATEWAARLIPTFSAWLTVLAGYWLARRLLGTRAAFLGGLVLTLTSGFIQCGRILVIDNLLTLCVTVSLLAAHEAIRSSRLRWGWWLASACCCGLGVLAKGPVALVLLAPPTIAFAWLDRAAARPRLTGWLAYGAVVAGLFAPWFVAITLRDPTFPHEFVVNQHLKRYFAGEFHAAPIWYYVPLVLVSGMPWSLLGLPMLWFMLSRARQVRALRPAAFGFLVLWAGWCLLFFSLSRGKLPPYILPAAPALALLVGACLERLLFQTPALTIFRNARSLIPRTAAILLAAAWLTAMICFWQMKLIDPFSKPGEFVDAAVCVICIVGLAVWGGRLSPKAMWACCATVVFTLAFDVGHELVPAWAEDRSLFAEPSELKRLLESPGTVVACYGREWGSVPFYLPDVEVRNFHKRNPEQLWAFLREHRRTLLIVKSNNTPETMPWVTPAGMHVTEFVTLGEANVLVIEPVPTTSVLAAR
jgi:4-amino-4-deoxy-L-arabinose transferase-like glycosyltransferase